MEVISEFMFNYRYLLSLIVVSIILIICAIFSRKTIIKQIFYNLSSIIIALIFYEVYLNIRSDTHKEKAYNLGSYSKGDYFQKSSLLGYVPKPFAVVTSKKYTQNGIPIYDVSYTIKDGRRFVPNTNNESTKAAIFFGCSITFGEGVPDSSTMPFYFNEFAGHRYKVFDYGFHGYGPHQMLAIIESKLNGDLRNNKISKAIAFYSCIPDHIRRCAGYNKWDLDGPRYELVSNKLLKAGRFEKSQKTILNSVWLTEAWQSSLTYKTLFSPERKKPTHYDVLRTVAVINRSKEILQTNGISLTIIAWDSQRNSELIDKKELDFFYSSLLKLNIPVWFVSNIINDFQDEKERDKYFIKNDGHPNAHSYELVAKFIQHQIKDSTK